MSDNFIIPNNKIQEKIKKMMKEKKLAKQNPNLTEMQRRKRAASQTILQPSQNNLTKFDNQQQLSIRTEWRKRKTDSSKHRQTETSSTTKQTSQNSRAQLQRNIVSLMTHSPKLGQFCEQNGLGKTDSIQQLMGNELFMMSLGTKLARIPITDQRQYNCIIESQLILKLKKQIYKKKQVLAINDTQTRIKSLINGRLEKLMKKQW